MTKEFDLNIEKILENWEVYHAVREIIANALDEQKLTGTKDISIRKENGIWHITDYGRGLNYHHLTQNENDEKLSAEGLIGKFGVGLKDSLAVFYRNGIHVTIRSCYGVITLKQMKKAGFDDVMTLKLQIQMIQTWSARMFHLMAVRIRISKKQKNFFSAFRMKPYWKIRVLVRFLRSRFTKMQASIFMA